MSVRRTILKAALPFCLFAVSALGVTHAAEAQTLRLAHASSTNSLIDQAMHYFADDVAKRTGGKLKIQDFPNAELGDEGPIADGVGSGSSDIGLGGVVDDIDPRLNVLALPFLFSDLNNVHRVLDGPVGTELKAMGQNHGYQMLGFLDSGFRNFANSRHPIATPADIKGMKLRTPPISVILDTLHTLGALPQSIPFGQVYTALQSHVVDGVEPELRDYSDEKWYEVAKYVSISNYIWTANYWYMNKDRYDALPADERAALDASVADTTTWYRAQLASVYASLDTSLTAKGVKFNTVNTVPFQAMVAPVYAKYGKIWGADLVAQVQQAAKADR
ncbi:TRAP transporter substrate-binding protein [Acidisoma silvae]|uniref:TRAP transporter substrate-binding protein n=1 Tax=Acidisoma silvae TaxID=2802396 RepID=A0A963YTL2_9PROT|nr:TRAP transporter substrate-binding protein [Acidisoma silvae]MCB8876778.1 TRAP transporter substrate-binding protein [Acidisoma silvae]